MSKATKKAASTAAGKTQPTSTRPNTYSTIQDIKKLAMLNTRVKLQVRIESHGEPGIDGKTGEPLMAISVGDIEGKGSLRNIQLRYQTLIDVVQDNVRSCPSFEVVGTVIGVRAGRRIEYSLNVEDVRPCGTALAIIRASDSETKRAKRKIQTLTTRKVSLLDYIRDELAGIIGIVGLDKHHALQEALDLIVMQAVSEGHIGNASARIHTFVIGRPASGKKLLSLAAAILNPCSEEVGKSISKAGLVGHPSQKDGAWRPNFGALPRANHGAVYLEDYHELRTAERREFESRYSKVMEDGYVVDTKVGNFRYETLVAFHIDSNLPSQVSVEDVDQQLDAKFLPHENVLSRIDYFSVMPDVPEVADAVAQEMGRRLAKTNRSHVTRKVRRERALKVLVAVLKERYQQVTVSPGTVDAILALYKGITSDYKSGTPAGAWLQSYVTRKMIQIHKLVRALAALDGRQRATSKHVKAAEEIVLRTVSTLHGFVAPTTPGPNMLDGLIWQEFSDCGHVAPSDIGRFIRVRGLDTTSGGESLRNKANRILKRLEEQGRAEKKGYRNYSILRHPGSRRRPDPDTGLVRTPVVTEWAAKLWYKQQGENWQGWQDGER